MEIIELFTECGHDFGRLKCFWSFMGNDFCSGIFFIGNDRSLLRREHLPIERFVPPQEFAELKAFGMSPGFRHVESGPQVRSSYHADEQARVETLN